MYFRISEQVGLRSWQKVTGAYYMQNEPYAKPLTKAEFEMMLRCDGEHDIEPDQTAASLAARGLIEVCRKGEAPSEWSRYHRYDNRYFPRMNLMITGKCNYNCLHCFNAADNAPLMSEWRFDELCELFRQAKDCGIHALTITGGEPMVHKRFLDILREIHRQGMFVEELNTNGYFLTPDILSEMKSFGCNPLMKISFDGLGYHDWMRNRKGAEEQTLQAIAMCVGSGFRVKAQTQVHRKNVSAMLPTAAALNDMGVSEMRIIRTTEVPRWTKNAGDACLPVPEYYQEMLAFAAQYKALQLRMDIDIWQFLRLYPETREYEPVPVVCADGEYQPNRSACRGNRGMIAVTSSGEVVPCMQMSGYLTELNIHLGNLHDTPLSEIIRSGAYPEIICTTVGDVRERSEKCAACRYFPFCTGGCRALGLLYSGQRKDFCGEDITKCMYFENGWYEKVTEAFSDWKNLKPMHI